MSSSGESPSGFPTPDQLLSYAKAAQESVIPSGELSADFRLDPAQLDQVRAIYEQAIAQVGLFVDSAGELWGQYRAFELRILSLLRTEEEKEAQISRVRALFQRQLQLPLTGIQFTYKQYREWEESLAGAATSPSTEAAANTDEEKVCPPPPPPPPNSIPFHWSIFFLLLTFTQPAPEAGSKAALIEPSYRLAVRALRERLPLEERVAGATVAAPRKGAWLAYIELEMRKAAEEAEVVLRRIEDASELERESVAGVKGGAPGGAEAAGASTRRTTKKGGGRARNKAEEAARAAKLAEMTDRSRVRAVFERCANIDGGGIEMSRAECEAVPCLSGRRVGRSIDSGWIYIVCSFCFVLRCFVIAPLSSCGLTVPSRFVIRALYILHNDPDMWERYVDVLAGVHDLASMNEPAPAFAATPAPLPPPGPVNAPPTPSASAPAQPQQTAPAAPDAPTSPPSQTAAPPAAPAPPEHVGIAQAETMAVLQRALRCCPQVCLRVAHCPPPPPPPLIFFLFPGSHCFHLTGEGMVR